MSDVGSIRCPIPKLTGPSSWLRWSSMVALTLKQNKLFGYADGSAKPPSRKDASKYDDFVAEDAKAQSIIIGWLDDINHSYIAGCKTAAESWKKLKSVYESPTAQQLDHTLEQFFNVQRDCSENMISHVSRLQKLFDDVNRGLKQHGQPEMCEFILLTRVIASLPPEYNSFKENWDNKPISERTLNVLVERLTSFEERIGRSVTSDSAALLVAKQSNKVGIQGCSTNKSKTFGKGSGVGKNMKNSTRIKTPMSDITCFRCNMKGHYCSHCPEWKKIKDDVPAVLVVHRAADPNAWIIDSGASNHMTCAKSYFNSYKAFVVPQKLQVAGSGQLTAYGMGSVNFQARVKGKWHPLTLEDVWYVPDLQRNLLSTGSAMKKGAKINFLNGMCIICLGNRTVAVGYQQSTLCTLDIRVRVPNKPAEAYLVSHTDVLQVSHERSTEPAEVINADVAGPMEVTSIGGSRFTPVLKNGSDESGCIEEGCPGNFQCSNGVPECANGKGVKLCDCTVDQFHCNTGGCVMKSQGCDGLDECPDRSDEWKLQIRSADNEWHPVCADGWNSTLSDSSDDEVHHARRYPLRENRGLPSKYDDYKMAFLCFSEPQNYNEAISSDNSCKWKCAMDEEINSLLENKTWELVDPPEGKTILNNRWVLRIKLKVNGDIDRFKARLVCRGFEQKEGIDYGELFSPVARFETVRAVLGLSAARRLYLLQFDIKTAFLYGQLDRAIFMKQPEGYDDGTGRVCKLIKSPKWLLVSYSCFHQRNKNLIPENWVDFGGGSMFDEDKPETQIR